MSTSKIQGALAVDAEGFSLAESAKPKPIAETEAETATRSPMEDYVVSLSEIAKEIQNGDNPFAAALAKASGQSSDSEEDSADQDPVIRSIKSQIARVKAEIARLKQSDMPQDTKQKHIALKQNQLTELQNQLQQALEEKLKNQGSTTATGFYATGSLT